MTLLTRGAGRAHEPRAPITVNVERPLFQSCCFRFGSLCTGPSYEQLQWSPGRGPALALGS